jgi:uracil-DNA glycosylase family 4
MDGRIRVLSTANGPCPAQIMLVGEAPGRLGAERSGEPFAGDESGRRLERLITAAGWRRAEVFITNAVLCNPQDTQGRNRPPRMREVTNCTCWLARQVELVDPILVVALGRVALRALQRTAHHEIALRDAGAPPVRWNDRWLAVTYHPSARAAIHRPLERQLADFEALGDWWGSRATTVCTQRSDRRAPI